MASIEELKKQYQDLNDTFDTAPLEVIKSDLLMAFEYEYPGLYMFHAHVTEFSEKGWVSSFLVKEQNEVKSDLIGNEPVI